MTAAGELTSGRNEAGQGGDLLAMLRRVQRREQLIAIGLIAPLFLFILVSFVVPIGSILWRSVWSPELSDGMPRTVASIGEWDGKSPPSPALAAALIADLRDAMAQEKIGVVAKRLNYAISGFRSLVTKTARQASSQDISADQAFAGLVGIDERWNDLSYWRAIKDAASPLTGFFLLSGLDLTRDADGRITRAAPDQRIYVDVFGRTFWISFVVTVICLAMGYPLAYLLASLPPRKSNLLMIFVLLPFWSSLLVRTTAWLVLLQREGVINNFGHDLGLWTQPLELIHNRFGTYVAMVHILLPFMVLPIYSVMKGIPPIYMKAAAGLGAGPLRSFREVYLPQSLPGVAAGCLLVFILALGYYITPALTGGAGDQMISYLIAIFANTTINWGMAGALSLLLLIVIGVLFYVFDRLVGIDAMRGR